MIKCLIIIKISLATYLSVYLYAPFMVVSTSCGVSRPIYEGVYKLEDTVRDFFTRHGWQHNLRIGPPPP